jgi:alkyl hydroperoxide reductase subunit AhpC
MMEKPAKKEKMPIYNSLHDMSVAQIATQLKRKKFAVVIDTTNKKLRRIPDLLVVSPKGEIQWIEVESQRHGKKKHKLKEVVRALHQVKGKVILHYVED